ncbi:glucose-1-phosphate thymidylyltransferase [Streptomyces diacarni]|uniref:Glucose-1-phosphate thymidylyltransferase n=1 Tax=Streptomyces diacarni TaxID=2800381 RepID=A0A367FER3_9ACTN|nr:glucose-1-phosphate thymidylyltransferase [Streptomyces diacarni]RCG28761.1 glucose-1-phosphate thymidylyltransferase [Streptomyces diacarni]
MKALVLSGGAGSRLRPFSHTTPKQLVPVAGKPVLFHALDALTAAGIDDIGLIVGEADGPVSRAVRERPGFDARVTCIAQDAPRGLAHCVLIARDFLGDDDFTMYLGDNIFQGGITDTLDAFRARRPTAQLAVRKVTDPGQYGIAELDAEGRVIALQEKPEHPRSDLAITGAYVFTSEIHEAVRAIGPSARGELEITDAVQWLVSRGRTVTAHHFSRYWADTGTLTDLLACNKVLLQALTPAVGGSVDEHSRLLGPVVVEEGATLRASVVEGPAIIGRHSTLVNCRVGPYSAVGAHCRIEASDVADSVLLDRSTVQGVHKLRGSIIGKAADIRRDSTDPGCHKLLVGDDSRVFVPG